MECEGHGYSNKALSRIKDEVDVSIIAYGKDFDKTIALASSLGLRLNVLPKVPHERLNEYYWNADVVLDRFKLGSLGMVSLEAIACGRPVVSYVSSKHPEYKDFPLKDVNTSEEIVSAVVEASFELWQKEYNYLEKNHKPENVVKKLMDVYSEVYPIGKT